MFKKLLIIMAVVALVFTFTVAPARAEMQDMWAYVYKWTGAMNANGTLKLTRLTTGVTFKVLALDSDTAETLYYYNNDAYTSLTNPVTTTSFESATICNDQVSFRVDPTDSTDDRYVDLIVVDSTGGYTLYYEGFDKHTHALIIDERPNVLHHGCIWFAVSSNAETDTGIDFTADTYVHDVRLEVVTVDAGETYDVGLLSSESGGDANGYRDGVSVATAGFPTDTGIVTAGASADYHAVTTYGALLVTAITGTGAYASATGFDNGGKSYIGHIVAGASACSLTYTGSAGTDTAVGYIHFWFTRMR